MSQENEYYIFALATERTRESGLNRRDILYPDAHAQVRIIDNE